jgi:hypothetical protein
MDVQLDQRKERSRAKQSQGFILIVVSLTMCASASNLPPSPPIIATPTPTFDAIDYAHPERYLTLHASLGDHAAIMRAAAEARELAADPTQATLAWFDAHIHNDVDHPYVWRPFEVVVHDAYWMSCADRAVAIGTMLRAMGIPTVWVKSMDIRWIRKRDATYRGHVYLEVFVDSAWRLLDPVTERIFKDYDTRSRILPGRRFAYDKGGDPYTLVLSMRQLEWRAQTDAYFAHFDLGLLAGHELP